MLQPDALTTFGVPKVAVRLPRPVQGLAAVLRTCALTGRATMTLPTLNAVAGVVCVGAVTVFPPSMLALVELALPVSALAAGAGSVYFGSSLLQRRWRSQEMRWVAATSARAAASARALAAGRKAAAGSLTGMGGGASTLGSLHAGEGEGERVEGCGSPPPAGDTGVGCATSAPAATSAGGSDGPQGSGGVTLGDAAAAVDVTSDVTSDVDSDSDVSTGTAASDA